MNNDGSGQQNLVSQLDAEFGILFTVLYVIFGQADLQKKIWRQ